MPTTLTNTTDLIRFLLARVDEDEARLRSRRRAVENPDAVQRLRAEALAKRQIIGAAQQLLVLRDQPCEKPVRDGAAMILRCLAGPYSGHRGYRSEWVVARAH